MADIAKTPRPAGRYPHREAMHEYPIMWRTRWLMVWAAVATLVTGRHHYLSTGCLAGRHDYCDSMTGAQGEKRPGRSKFSDAPCICWCH